MAFTYGNLTDELIKLNRKMKVLAGGSQFGATKRNGYTGLDLYREGRMQCNLECGTPKECYHKALEYVVNLIDDEVLETLRNPLGL